MTDEGFVAEARERAARERAYLRERLTEYGFEVRPSEAPFVLCDIGEEPTALLSACREHGVVLRDATTFSGLDSHVRIAVRNRDATEQLCSVLDEVW